MKGFGAEFVGAGLLPLGLFLTTQSCPPPPHQDSRVLREGTQVSSGRTVSKELLLTAAPSDNMAAYRCNASSDAKGTPLSALTRLRVQCEWGGVPGCLGPLGGEWGLGRGAGGGWGPRCQGLLPTLTCPPP